MEKQNRKFNKWTLINKIDNNDKWRAVCECGFETTVYKSNVTSGKSKQCIQCQAKLTANRMSSHNQSTSKLYNVWAGIKRRCYNEKQTSYKYYGAKGVSMCDEWKNSFEAFSHWAESNGYKDGVAVSRFGDSGNYEPDNCKIQSFSDNAKEIVRPKFTEDDTRRLSIKLSSLSNEQYFEVINKAISGEYKSRELCEEYSLDRHVLLHMCRYHGEKPLWRKTILTNDEISEMASIRIEQNLSTVELGDIFNVSHECIASTLKSIGLYSPIQRRKKQDRNL